MAPNRYTSHVVIVQPGGSPCFASLRIGHRVVLPVAAALIALAVALMVPRMFGASPRAGLVPRLGGGSPTTHGVPRPYGTQPASRVIRSAHLRMGEIVRFRKGVVQYPFTLTCGNPLGYGLKQRIAASPGRGAMTHFGASWGNAPSAAVAVTARGLTILAC